MTSVIEKDDTHWQVVNTIVIYAWQEEKVIARKLCRLSYHRLCPAALPACP